VIYPIIRGVQLVGGLTMGADPFLGALLYQAHSAGEKLDAFIVRKEAKGHGMQKRIEGPFFEGGAGGDRRRCVHLRRFGDPGHRRGPNRPAAR
jgi:hypothetical protein